MKNIIKKISLLFIFLVSIVGTTLAQANHDLNFVLRDVYNSEVRITQPRMATLNKSNPTATMDALFVTSDYEAIVNMEFSMGSGSANGYVITIQVGNTVVQRWNTSQQGKRYYGPIPLNKNSNETTVVLYVEKALYPF